MDQMGWAVAISSLGSAAANPCFGLWNQRTLSTKKPLSAGFLCCAVGNFLYGLLPVVSFHLYTPVLYFSRFLIGVGVGNCKKNSTSSIRFRHLGYCQKFHSYSKHSR